MIHGGEESRGFGPGGDIARVLVLDAEDERSLGRRDRPARAALKQRDRNTHRDRRAPVRKHPDDTSPRTLCDVERAARELGLIVEPERRAEHVLPGYEARSAGHLAARIEDRRRDREDTHAARFDLRSDRVDLCVGMLEDVPAVDDPKLGERHAEAGHRPKRAIQIVR
jgi:hypothetical protein